MYTSDNVFLPWSEHTEELFKEDLTKDYEINPNHISAVVVADSVNEANNQRITTLKIQVPKFILAEINTHRVLSKSFQSSRAVPNKVMREKIEKDPFIPIYFGKNKSGMNAVEKLEPVKKTICTFWWKMARNVALVAHKQMEKAGLHKQSANRILEPFMCVTGTLTSTDWDNFFRLRYSKDAQPEFIAFVKCVHDAIVKSTPKVLKSHETHLPYITDSERETLSKGDQVVASVARCCRSSYGRNGQVFPIEKDRELFKRLIEDCHFSPFEHVALCPTTNSLKNKNTRNFTYWLQLRSYLEPNFQRNLTKLFGLEKEQEVKSEQS